MSDLDHQLGPRPTEARSFKQTIRGWVAEYGLSAMVIVALVSHGYNIFNYPLYLGDEGIYLEQAWAVLREGQLAPYTYFYDHAPVGWLLIAIWEFLLPGHFHTFGMAINSARVFMLLIDLGSTALLYRIARRITGSDFAAIAASLAFTLSPLEIYYQRMVLLDNIMVFWILLTIDLLLLESRRIVPILASGLCFGIATLCKENSVFLLPVIGYLLYDRVRGTYRTRFSLVGWSVCAGMFISLYPLYALLKGELFPADTVVGQTPAHVSLISTVVWQLGRHGGSILNSDSQFWLYFWGDWWYKDPVIIVAGVAATAINLFIGLSDRERYRDTLVASLLSIAFIFYLIRGSVMIDFYVVPVLPLFALNVGLLLFHLTQVRAGVAGHLLTTVATVGMLAMVVAFIGQSHDEYFVNQTKLQQMQLAFIRQNIPSNAMILIDDDLWVDMHDPQGKNPVYPYANSHWKIAEDPAIGGKLLHNNWQNLDYLVMSNKLHDIFEQNGETLALTAYDHSRLLARFEEGDVAVEVRQVIKPDSSA